MSSPPLLRPWGQFLSTTAISPPISLSETTDRLFQNLRFFATNYLLLLLLSISIFLLPHPLSLLLILILSAAWAHLYLLRTDPLDLMGFELDDRILVGFLGVLTLLGLVWARVWGSLVLGGVVGAVIVGFHAVVRAPEEDVEGSPYGELLSDLDGGGVGDGGEGGRGDYVRV